jgi:hypothetical protein
LQGEVVHRPHLLVATGHEFSGDVIGEGTEPAEQEQRKVDAGSGHVHQDIARLTKTTMVV